jgi:hypothetical protein
MKIVENKISLDELKKLGEKMKNNKPKIKYHKGLTCARWNKFTFVEQMANVGSEVERMIKWREKNPEYTRLAFERALELLDLTIADPKNKMRLKEIVRVRELLCDYFFENKYSSTDKSWQNYFYAFNWAARRKF